MLATCRRAEDGGLDRLDEDERRRRLREALEAGADLVDVEHDAAFREDLTRDAHRVNAKVVVSNHRETTPAPDEIVAELADLAEDADVAKLATASDGPGDAQALAEAALQAPEIGTPFALMGTEDSLVRGLASPLGQALVYADPDGSPVPGQLPVDLQARLPRQPPSPAPRNDYVLLGHPVGHSLSPPMQEAGFAHLGIEARYRLLDVAPEDLETVLEGLAVDTAGGNTTAPHKVDLYEAADRATDEAHEVGAANTFRFDDGDLAVHMTDGLGARDALEARGHDLAGRPALVLGAGGTARALTHALAQAGAEIRLANRTRKRAERLADAPDADVRVVDLEPEALAQALPVDGVVVNATPVDPPVPDDALSHAVAFDANYGHRAAFAQRARQAGACTLDGLDLLVAQGVRSLAFWIGEDVDEATRARMSTAARTRALERACQEAT